MASTSVFLNLFFFLIINLLPPSRPQHVKAVNGGFAVRLIHRDSPLSPFYNPSMTKIDRIQAAVHRSISRLNHLNSLTSPSLAPDISSKIVPDSGEYLMFFSIGTPPTRVHGIADTASNLIWVQCTPCENCHAQIPPIFDSSKSSTYQTYSCSTPTCDDLGEYKTCWKFLQPCYFRIDYGDMSMAKGNLSYDKFNFEDPYRNNVEVGYIDFGCSDETLGIFKGNQSGVVGLNRGALSLVSQLELKRFAYCMVIPDNEGSGSRMYFGSMAVISGGQTPLVKEMDTHYYLTLEGISIGDERIPIPSEAFDIIEGGMGGFIIDSGTTYTMLQTNAFDALVEALRKAINLPQMSSPRSYFELCFAGTFADLALQPDVTFHFYGTDVILMKETTYEKVNDGLWCLGILRSDHLMSILGNMQQRNYYVGYDLEAGVVSFAPVDCAIF